MTNWITDEHGNQTFAHEGWTVRIWSADSPWRRIDVSAPNVGRDNFQVEVTPEGIWVSGEICGEVESWPSAFTIPWAVIGAIIEARAIVG